MSHLLALLLGVLTAGAFVRGRDAEPTVARGFLAALLLSAFALACLYLASTG